MMVFHPLVLFWFRMRKRYLRHLNTGPAYRAEGSCELVKWRHVSQQW